MPNCTTSPTTLAVPVVGEVRSYSQPPSASPATSAQNTSMASWHTAAVSPAMMHWLDTELQSANALSGHREQSRPLVPPPLPSPPAPLPPVESRVRPPQATTAHSTAQDEAATNPRFIASVYHGRRRRFAVRGRRSPCTVKSAAVAGGRRAAVAGGGRRAAIAADYQAGVAESAGECAECIDCVLAGCTAFA